MEAADCSIKDDEYPSLLSSLSVDALRFGSEGSKWYSIYVPCCNEGIHNDPHLSWPNLYMIRFPKE